jgi:hypothetical protein
MPYKISPPQKHNSSHEKLPIRAFWEKSPYGGYPTHSPIIYGQCLFKFRPNIFFLTYLYPYCTSMAGPYALPQGPEGPERTSTVFNVTLTNSTGIISVRPLRFCVVPGAPLDHGGWCTWTCSIPVAHYNTIPYRVRYYLYCIILRSNCTAYCYCCINIIV